MRQPHGQLAVQPPCSENQRLVVAARRKVDHVLHRHRVLTLLAEAQHLLPVRVRRRCPYQWPAMQRTQACRRRRSAGSGPPDALHWWATLREEWPLFSGMVRRHLNMRWRWHCARRGAGPGASRAAHKWARRLFRPAGRYLPFAVWLSAMDLTTPLARSNGKAAPPSSSHCAARCYRVRWALSLWEGEPPPQPPSSSSAFPCPMPSVRCALGRWESRRSRSGRVTIDSASVQSCTPPLHPSTTGTWPQCSRGQERSASQQSKRVCRFFFYQKSKSSHL